jgi:hypothetical protein
MRAAFFLIGERSSGQLCFFFTSIVAVPCPWSVSLFHVGAILELQHPCTTSWHEVVPINL